MEISDCLLVFSSIIAMAQSYMVGVFFAIGLVSGLVISLLVTNYAVLHSSAAEGYLNFYEQDLRKLTAALNTSTVGPPKSHDEVYKDKGKTEVIKFEDTHKHEGMHSLIIDNHDNVNRQIFTFIWCL